MNDFLRNVFGFITIIFIIYLFAAYEKAEDTDTQFNLVKSTTKVIHQIIEDAEEGWNEAKADTNTVAPTPDDSTPEVQ